MLTVTELSNTEAGEGMTLGGVVVLVLGVAVQNHVQVFLAEHECGEGSAHGCRVALGKYWLWEGREPWLDEGKGFVLRGRKSSR